ncbi:MAG: hypothetical protein CUN56_05360 [Phototrophicales bacterium]|nr:MAG: hypothetical protein CUN56_05360 [Phototrophicales bacterium]RMG73835.1 MAG: hypothetical protein D6711_10120 [Chloroflexota bacterium]
MIQTVLDQFLKLVYASRPVEFEELQTVAGHVVSAAEVVSEDERNHAIAQMTDAILASSPMRCAMVSLTCGALVEQGAHPKLAVDHIRTRLGEMLGLGAVFAQTCIDRAKEDGHFQDDAYTPEQAVSDYADQVASGMPDKAGAYAAIDILCRPMIAMASRSMVALQGAQEDGLLMSRLKKFPVMLPMLDWLNQLLTVLIDEPLIVLHPGLKRGYAVRINGVVGNFQLFTLLEDALIGDERQGWLPGHKPPVHVVESVRRQVADPPSASIQFNYANWQALKSDGTLDVYDAKPFWIWGEGKPADIHKFDGVRVMLLSEPPYTRMFSMTAPFAGLTAQLTIDSILSDEQVEEWLMRIAARHGQSA